jgi:hypothetical protein
MSSGIVNAGGSAAYNGTITNGNAEFLVDPKGPTYVTYRGFLSGTMGSIAPPNWRGFPIYGLYQVNSDGTTEFVVTGDSTAFHPVLTVGGVDQLLGAGVLSGGQTTYSSASPVSDPFTVASAPVTIS